MTQPLIDHLESVLGPIQSGVELCPGVQATRFDGTPFAGCSTFATLGLSSHALSQATGPLVRIELLLAVRPSFIDVLNPYAKLADVVDALLAGHAAPPRGTVFGPRGPLFPGCRLEALYFSPPVYFDPRLPEFRGFKGPFVPVWLVPIARIEAEFVQKHGWARFEECLESANPDLADLLRDPIVDHA